MATKQTFIIQHWYGAETYLGAARREANEGHNPKEYDHDFNRVGCKRLQTALKYLKNWRKQAKERGWEYLYAVLIRDDARYEIRATPDGYHEEGVAAKGWMKEFDEQLSKAA